jgi:predicted oxidoreductase
MKLSPLIIGTMRLGKWGVNMSTKELENFIDTCLYLDLIDFDHADIYGDYTEESRFGNVIKRRPDLKNRLRITTKCSIKLISENRPDHKVKSYDSTKSHIIQSAENSIKELGVDKIDLFLLHRPDYLLNPLEVAEAFENLSSRGLVLHFGVSNFSKSQVELLQKDINLTAHQIEVSLMQNQALDDGTLDQCLALRINPCAWSPFGGGDIFKESYDPILTRVRLACEQLSYKYNCQIDQLLLAWLLKHPAGIIPVIGSTKINRIKAAKDALEINLSHEDWYLLLEAARGQEVP